MSRWAYPLMAALLAALAAYAWGEATRPPSMQAASPIELQSQPPAALTAQAGGAR